MSKKLRKSLLVTIKLLIAVSLLVWVFSRVHWHDYVVTKDGTSYTLRAEAPPAPTSEKIPVSRGIWWWRSETTISAADCEPVPGADSIVRKGFASSMSNLRPVLLALAVAGFLVMVLVTVVRWWLLLRIQRIHIPLWEVTRLTFLGCFFNAVVPGTVGGDIVKAYYVAKHTKLKAAALLSIFVDRILGLTELAILAAVMAGVILTCGLVTFADMRMPLAAVAIAMAILTATLTLLLSGRARRLLHVQKLYRRLPIAHHIAAVGDAARLYRKHMGTLLRAILITFGAHVIWVGSIALLGMSLHLETSWYLYFVYVPVIYIIGAVPVTPGGVGVVETLYVGFFISSTVGASEILALALLARLILIFWSLPGAVVAVTGPKIPKAREMKAELGLQAEQSDTPA